MYQVAIGILKNEEDAKDAVGETVLKAYEHLENLRDVKKFKYWIMKILMNEAKTMWRKRNKVIASGDMMAMEGITVDEHYELLDTIQTLPDEFRNVLTLYYYQGLTMKEVGKIMGMPEGTVKSRLNRGRVLLRGKI